MTSQIKKINAAIGKIARQVVAAESPGNPDQTRQVEATRANARLTYLSHLAEGQLDTLLRLQSERYKG